MHYSKYETKFFLNSEIQVGLGSCELSVVTAMAAATRKPSPHIFEVGYVNPSSLLCLVRATSPNN